eukprot:m.263947 g.263947  ORF g.263947 m.263947 type:complete len:459 (+) comp19715_c0_seq1:242-1618(+)
MSETEDPEAIDAATQKIKKLSEKADQVKQDIGLHYDSLNVYKSAIQRNMIHAATEHSAGNLQFAYVHYHKAIVIAVELMPKHAKYNDPKNFTIVKQARKEVTKALEEAEKLKALLKKEFVRDAVAERNRKNEIARKREEAENAVPTIKELEARISAAFASRNSRHVERTTAEKLLAHHQQLARAAAGPALVQESLALNPNLTKATTTVASAHPRPPALGTNASGPTSAAMDGRQQPAKSSGVEPIPVPRKRQPLYPELPLLASPTSEPSILSDVGGTGGLGPGGLRWVHLPKNLVKNFLGFAQHNSDDNRETCGILAAEIKHNELYVSALLIPEQTGGPDSCDVQDDLPLFDYMQQKGYMNMGWIHTHPSQTAFLSSVDLHTHCQYQRMLKEAIAIVCSIKFDDDQIFHLTQYGLNVISGCHKAGFHPHSERHLFANCHHVVVEEDMRFDIRDFRKTT